jgi:hypothetical protein
MCKPCGFDSEEWEMGGKSEAKARLSVVLRQDLASNFCLD